MEPGARHAPLALDGGGRDAHDFGGLFDGESTEEAEFDELGLVGIEGLEAVECFVEFVEGDFGNRGDTDVVFDGKDLRIAATFLGALVAGVIDEDAAHELGGDTEEVGPALPVNACLIDQLHVRFVDERRGLQSMIGAFAAHVVGGDASQFGIDD